MYADENIKPIGKSTLDYVKEIIFSETTDYNIRNSAYWYIYHQLQDNKNLKLTDKYIRDVVRAKQGWRVNFN